MPAPTDRHVSDRRELQCRRHEISSTQVYLPGAEVLVVYMVLSLDAVDGSRKCGRRRNACHIDGLGTQPCVALNDLNELSNRADEIL